MISPLRILYLALALWGAVQPVLWLVHHQAGTGDGLLHSLRAFHTETGQTGAGLSMMIAGIALSLWALAETWVRRNWIALIVLPLSVFPGPACALPLYLFLRTARVR